MAIKKCLIEWIHSEAVRTYCQNDEGEFDVLRPHGRDVFEMRPLPEGYNHYWKDWKGRNGYKEDDEVDSCFVAESKVNVDEFMAAARKIGIKFCSSTTWSIKEILYCLKNRGDCSNGCNQLSLPPLQVELDNGCTIWLQNACGQPFIEDDAFSSHTYHSDADDNNVELEQVINQTVCRPLEQPQTCEDSSDAASILEIRDAMRRKARQQCRDIDRKR